MIDRYAAVYPGHPITVGLFIMHAFTSLGAAAKREGDHNFTAASRSQDVPGAGGCVGSAMALLHNIADGFYTLDDAASWAAAVWSACDNQKQDNPKRWREGQDQADALLAEYVARAAWWIKATEAQHDDARGGP